MGGGGLFGDFFFSSTQRRGQEQSAVPTQCPHADPVYKPPLSSGSGAEGSEALNAPMQGFGVWVCFLGGLEGRMGWGGGVLIYFKLFLTFWYIHLQEETSHSAKFHPGNHGAPGPFIPQPACSYPHPTLASRQLPAAPAPASL